MTEATEIRWRVQVRAGRGRVWKNRGLFETRKDARAQAVYLRDGRMRAGEIMPGTGFGYGNTRVVRYVKGAK